MLDDFHLISEILFQVITQFLKLETLLDDSVDKKIELQIERGGTSMTVNLVVRLINACQLHVVSFQFSCKI